jgi:hypothetical protein
MAPRSASPAVGKPDYRLVNVILAAFTGTIPVNADTVLSGAQLAGSRVTLGAQALRLSYG